MSGVREPWLPTPMEDFGPAPTDLPGCDECLRDLGPMHTFTFQGEPAWTVCEGCRPKELAPNDWTAEVAAMIHGRSA